MKEKKITVYLSFGFENCSGDKFKNHSGYGVTRTGGEYLEIVKVEKRDKRYVDFDCVIEDFLAACESQRELIGVLMENYEGKFDIEVVPEVTAGSFPAITVQSNLIEFINSLGVKFGVLDFDTYFI